MVVEYVWGLTLDRMRWDECPQGERRYVRVMSGAYMRAEGGAFYCWLEMS